MSKKLEDKIKIAKENLSNAKARLKDVQENGDKAISDYDLRMGYDADFYLNRCPLLQNHVNYYQRILDELLSKPRQLSIF